MSNLMLLVYRYLTVHFEYFYLYKVMMTKIHVIFNFENIKHVNLTEDQLEHNMYSGTCMHVYKTTKKLKRTERTI